MLSPKSFCYVVGIVSAILLASPSFAQESPSLKMGDPAPALKIAKWIKGTPIQSLEGGIYVVEFWATWCAPCKAAMPHLSELANKYRGKIEFTGVNVWEIPNPTDEAYIAGVEEFVKGAGDKMAYNVAADGKDQYMSENWIKAAGVKGIPCTFVIDKGKIAWIGHPMQGLDQVLADVLAGDYDVEEYARKQREAEEADAVQINAYRKVEQAFFAREYEKTLKAIEEYEKAYPNDTYHRDTYDYFRLTAFANLDESKAMSFAKELLAKSTEQIASVGSVLASTDGLTKETYDFALQCLLSVKVQKKDDAFFHQSLAYAYYHQGQFDEAISLQERALELLEQNTRIRSFMKERATKNLKDALDKFKVAKQEAGT